MRFSASYSSSAFEWVLLGTGEEVDPKTYCTIIPMIKSRAEDEALAANLESISPLDVDAAVLFDRVSRGSQIKSAP